MRGVVTLVAACVLLSAAGSAEARSGFPWRERTSAYGHLSLSFTVDRITVGANRWSAALTIRNWDVALALHEDFALVTARGGQLPVTRAVPPLPETFGARSTWRGTIGGPGVPPHGSSVRLRLGTFRAVTAPNLFIRYVTRHAYDVP